MNIFFVSIFPEIFENFLDASLVKKAIEKGILHFEIINPREFCYDKHKKIDDEIYGWWAGMLMMAKPIIDAVESTIKKIKWDFQIIFPSPSTEIRNQKFAHSYSKCENIIFVCGRYEWIDYRFEQYFKNKYQNNFSKISLWKFVTLWWELPTMTMVESIVRLVSWVIQEEVSWQDESYQISQNMENLEYPQYTRPQEVEWFVVPEILLNWNHKEIEKWKQENSNLINN